MPTPALSICITATADRYPMLAKLLATVDDPAAEVCVSWWGAEPPPVRPPCELAGMVGPFCLGRGRNRAARLARGGVLAFVDADMLLPPAWLQAATAAARAGSIVAPLYQRLDARGGRVPGAGWGNLVVRADMWLAAGGYRETGRYGGEDTAMINDLKRTHPGLTIVRQECGLLHQWHTKATAWHKTDGGAP